MRLYLGVVPGIFPWLKEDIIHKNMTRIYAGVIFSYWSFRKKIQNIISKGLHDYFSFDGPIMVDSGAYSAFNSGVNIDIDDYLSFISKIDMKDDDTIVNLDVIQNPRKSKQNWRYLTNKLDINVLPVIHLPEAGNSYFSEDYIGLGGMVPAFKINQTGSVKNVAAWLVSLDQTVNKKYHGFGVGSPYHQIAFLDFLYSVDWIGWRRNAAVCSCYTPEGSIYIHEARKKKKKGRRITEEIFNLYAPPFIDSYEMLYREGTEGWVNRALWNVWWFLLAKDYKGQIEVSSYVLSLKKTIRQTELEYRTMDLGQFL
ncbi:MAG: hypothetical protein JSW11_21770 [Candidatus Heimdallarchaeota archaeon]|nr:MAG: hypothetical protein JSW11_21770 [Candidatus Heimdallarchaeota archaeon]